MSTRPWFTILSAALLATAVVACSKETKVETPASPAATAPADTSTTATAAAPAAGSGDPSVPPASSAFNTPPASTAGSAPASAPAATTSSAADTRSVSSTSGNHPSASSGETAGAAQSAPASGGVSSATAPGTSSVAGDGTPPGGTASASSDARNELSRLREDLANAAERLSAIERQQTVSAPGPATATGGVGASSPAGSVAGGTSADSTVSSASGATSEDIASLRRDLAALQARVNRLEGSQPGAR